MKTAVDKVKKGKGRVVNARFAALCAHYLFDPDFCNVASGWEKGVVEKNVQNSRRRIWSKVQHRKFSSFAELNAWLDERCCALWDELRHPEHGRFCIAKVLEQERANMMPMPAPFDGYVEREARVTSTVWVIPRIGKERALKLSAFTGSALAFAICWLMRKPWHKLWPDFNPAAGNYLLYGLLFLFCAPLLASWLHARV